MSLKNKMKIRLTNAMQTGSLKEISQHTVKDQFWQKNPYLVIDYYFVRLLFFPKAMT